MVMPDDADPAEYGNVLYVDQSGRKERDAALWINMAREALEEINRLAAKRPSDPVTAIIGQLKHTLGLMVHLEHEPPRSDDQRHNLILQAKTDTCIRALTECYDLSERLPKALVSIWTPTVASEIAEHALRSMPFVIGCVRLQPTGSPTPICECLTHRASGRRSGISMRAISGT